MISHARLLLKCPHCGDMKLIGVTFVDEVMGPVMCDSCVMARRIARPEEPAATPDADLDSSLLEITREAALPEPLEEQPEARAPVPTRWRDAAERQRFVARIVEGLGFTGFALPFWMEALDAELAADRPIDYPVLRRAADNHLRDRLEIELGISPEDLDTYLPRIDP